MVQLLELLIVTVLTLSPLCASASIHEHDFTHRSHRRNIVTSIGDSYDFIIVGGGVAGLVLASRLSEDSNTTVLVLEAGEAGDAVASSINVPGNTYYQSLVNSEYDWAYKTAVQPNANGRVLSWPRGKVLGGSSAINGMYFIRPSQIEVDTWDQLSSTTPGGNSPWSWSSFFEAMKKTETFTPPSADIQSEAGIQYTMASHGTSGPVHSSYSGYTFPLVGNWTTTLAGMGIPPTSDAAGGENWGAYVNPSSINPTNWTRSYSRSAYIDPLPPRSNLAILPSATVTRIIFSNSTSGNVTATAVEYAADSGSAKKTVKVNKEVILAGGSIGSPHVLLLSGVGPKDVLDAVSIPVQNELPGVGQHLQDHISAGLLWQTTEDTAGATHAAGGSLASSATFLSYINAMTAYVNSSTLLGSDAASFQASVASALDASASSLVPSTYPEVVAGYKAIYTAAANTLLPSAIGQIELLMSLTSANSVIVQAALQHPLSQGRIYINSTSAFDAPVIDPAYLSHSADVTIMREGLKLARAVGAALPLASSLGTEVTPGSSVSSDADWETWLRNNIATEFHPASTCAMLPQAQGGVVDAELKVYGLANVRVADASVFPLAFSAHLGAPTYALAEQAAAIIRAQYDTVAPSSSSASGSGSSTSPSAAPSTTHSSASLRYPSRALWVALGTLATGILVLL